MKRDINLKLTSFLDEVKIRQLFGVSKDYFNWKNHFLFQTFNSFPKYFIFGSKNAVTFKPPNQLIGNYGVYIKLYPEMPPNTGKYELFVTIVIPVPEFTIFFRSSDYLHFIAAFPYTYRSGNLRVGDSLKFKVDTDIKTIQYFLNGNLINENEKYDRLNSNFTGRFIIFLQRNTIIQINKFIKYFQNF
jgi:hypothetical protein